tara:strand:- start:123 stop:740 length:618 start_codon:yes stop_codon:yes gene_type:complete
MPITLNGSGTLTGVSVGGLPDGIVDTDMLAANAVTAAKASGLGITHARIYRIHTTFILTTGSATLSANWEYEDDASAGNLGSGWSLPSSGVFSFPATGIYMVKGHTLWNSPSGTNTPYGGLSLQGTTDNFSSIDYRSDAYSSQSDDLSTTRYHNVHLGGMFDVTDTSNVKFKLLAFRDANYGNISFIGSSDHNYTYVEVIRLGDT